MCSSVTLSTTNPTWTETLGEKLGLVSENVLCYIISYVNTEFFLHPLQIHNGCPSLFDQTPPQYHHAHVVPQYQMQLPVIPKWKHTVFNKHINI